MNKHDIEIQQGATFTLAITWRDGDGVAIPLTGYTAAMQVRASYTATDKLVDITDSSSSQGQITLGGAEGTIDIKILASHTATLTAPTSKAVWDLILTDGSGNKTRLLEGQCGITPQVTR